MDTCAAHDPFLQVEPADASQDLERMVALPVVGRLVAASAVAGMAMAVAAAVVGRQEAFLAAGRTNELWFAGGVAASLVVDAAAAFPAADKPVA